MSNLSAFNFIGERSEATPGLWNSPLSILSANLAAINSDLTVNFPSGNTLSLFTGLEVSGGIHAQYVSVGSTPASNVTTAAVVIGVDSAFSDYIHFTDSSGARSDYVLGSRAGGTADGLNIWDASGATMIVSFSKQSVRFYQNVVGPVFDVGGALADTLNAATFGTGADSKESRIQAAISAASAAGISRVYLPANLYPYSAASVSFDTRVRMVREGGEWTVADVRAYGATGDGVVDDYAAIQSAIFFVEGSGGGVAYIPAGTYRITSGLTLAAALNNSIHIIGQGRRDTYILPTASALTALTSGTSGTNTQYVTLADFSISGTLASAKTGCGLWMIQPQHCNLRDMNIEEFDGANAVGLWLDGGSSLAYRNVISAVLIATSRRGLVLLDADENEFYSFGVGLITGASSAVTAIDIMQGRNNRFYGLLLSGDQVDLTARLNYAGLVLSNPPGGDNSGNQVYGLVAEGFDSGVSIGSAVTNTAILFYNPSINSVAIRDTGSHTLYWAPNTSTANPIYQYPSGSVVAPTFAFRSEGSLGLYRSGVSAVGLSYGQLQLPAGSALQPGLAFSSESSLGWYNSGASQMALSYGQILAPGGAVTRTGFAFSSSKSLGFYDAGSNIMGVVSSGAAVQFIHPAQTALAVAGSAILPPLGFQSERSLGIFRSGVSTIALSYGTLNLATQAVRLSMRTVASFNSTTMSVNEVLFAVGGASGVSLGIRSGGTIYYFESSTSTKG